MAGPSPLSSETGFCRGSLRKAFLAPFWSSIIFGPGGRALTAAEL